MIAIEKDKLSLKIRIPRMKNPEGREGDDALAQYRRHVWDDALLLFCFAVLLFRSTLF